MNTERFLEHVDQNKSPESDWHPALQALWHAENGEWDVAHSLCQLKGTPEGAWVHANLHREEGDNGNAGYWYQQAGKPIATGDVTQERREILTELLQNL